MLRFPASVAALALAACAPTTSTTANTTSSQATVDEPAGGEGLAPPTPADITLHIRAPQNGQMVQVPVNQRFAIELVGVPTAGYQWSPVQMPAFLTRVGDEITGPTIAAQNQAGYAGGDHWEVYTFAATSPGSGELVLEQRRPWEHGGPATATFRVTIVAR